MKITEHLSMLSMFLLQFFSNKSEENQKITVNLAFKKNHFILLILSGTYDKCNFNSKQ